MTGSDQQLGGPAPIWFGVLFLAVAFAVLAAAVIFAFY